ncbi:MAG: ParB N-terminal domain-containing protein [Desulfamplus sp.]|nr:ParB N-terminal domain-containing protein [Desulfamplus sp.]MBF0390664.1 ParB N-terminal domain-containing protein [Desulfamplus sp.]
MLNLQTTISNSALLKKRVKQVCLDAIDLSDESFKISSDNLFFSGNKSSSDNSLSNLTNLSNLALSIRLTGLINPIVLREIDDKYIVVSGFKRVSAMRSIGMRETPASILSHLDFDKDKTYDFRFYEVQSALIAISDNAFSRQLNVMEQARGVRLLKRFCSSYDIAQNSPAIFNVNMGESLINMLDDIANMPLSLHELIESDKLSMSSALKFKQYGYDKSLIESFATLFSKIKCSLSKQKEIITNIHEIAAREEISASDLIESKEISQILDSQSDNCSSNVNDENQKANLIRSILFNRRYPNLFKAKERFSNNLKMLNLNSGMKSDIKLDPPADFEGRDYTITLKFSTVEELAKKANILSALTKNPLFGDITD